jgi:hypothetical protein
MTIVVAEEEGRIRPLLKLHLESGRIVQGWRKFLLLNRRGESAMYVGECQHRQGLSRNATTRGQGNQE